MKIFYTIMFCIILLLTYITISLRSESTNFYGIADTKEIVINSETGVAIKRIFVVPGQTVRTGDTLVELSRPDLDLKISETGHQLDEIKTQSNAHVNLSRSEMLQLKAQQEARANELRAQIRELEMQYEINRKLVSELRSVKKTDDGSERDADSSNPIGIRIRQLKTELELALDPSQVSVDRLHNELSYAGDPLAEKVKGLRNDLVMMQKLKNDLFKTAQFGGVIGAVNFKEGETVSPFTPIITLHAESPSYVLGFIHENVYAKITLGQKVAVSSLADKNRKIVGDVVGVGSRIVEYPVRLRKTPEVQMWGREVTIKIPESNTFLLGEKVMNTIILQETKDKQSLLHDLVGQPAYAAGISQKPQSPSRGFTVADITCDNSINHSVTIEASGLVYRRVLGKYLVVSDDTPQKKALLYLMDASGKVENGLNIDGLAAINNMEGITQNEQGSIYIIASQSYNAKGNLPDPRKLFIRATMTGTTASLTGKILLYDQLRNAAEKDPGAPWAGYLLSGIRDRTIDIEGLACRGGSIYLGFKAPLIGKKAVIIKLNLIDSALSRGSINTSDIELWGTPDLTDPSTGAVCRISDMQFMGDTLYVLARAKHTILDKTEHFGTIWSCPDKNQSTLVRRFDDLKPEGLAFNPDSGSWCIVCDNGATKASQVLSIKVVP